MDTITKTTESTPSTVSPLDPEVADGLGDELLRSAAAANRVAKVSGTSFGSRAWTYQGNVD